MKYDFVQLILTDNSKYVVRIDEIKAVIYNIEEERYMVITTDGSKLKLISWFNEKNLIKKLTGE